MSSDNKRAEFEIALEYNPEAAKKAKEDIEAIKKQFESLGKTAKIGQLKVQQPRSGTTGRSGVTPAEHELKALAKVSRADGKRREDYESWWGKQLKTQDDAAKREARRAEVEANRRVKEGNALKAGEGMVAERLNKQQVRDQKAAEREVTTQIKKAKVDLAKISKQEAKDQERARSQSHREEIKAANERERVSRQTIAKASRETAASERQTLRYEKEIERIKTRSEKAEWRHNLRVQQRRDRMRSQGFSEAGSSMRSGGMRLGAGAIAAGTIGVQAHLAMSKGVGEIMTLEPAINEAEAKTMIKGGMSTYGGTTESNAKAIYDIASSGFDSSKEEIQTVFDAASKLAVGGVTDVATASDGLTGALNAWNMGADKAAFVTDQFFQSAKAGKLTIDQISSNIGTFGAVANMAGVSLPESMAVMAEATAKQILPGSAASGLQQMIKSITNPTVQAEKAAKRMGVKVGASAIRDAGGLEAWLTKMLSSKRFDEDRMGDIFSDFDGRKIVDALRSLGPEKLKGAFAQQRNATGSTQSAVDKMMATDHMRAQKIMGEVRVALVEFGEAIMPLVRDAMPHVTAGLQDLRKWLEKEENRNLLISATKVALMLGGVAAVGGPLSKFIGVLNLLSAGAIAKGFTNLTSSVMGASKELGGLGVLAGSLAGAFVLALNELDKGDAIKAQQDEINASIEAVNATTVQDSFASTGSLDAPAATAEANFKAAESAFLSNEESRTLWNHLGEGVGMLVSKMPRYLAGGYAGALTTSDRLAQTTELAAGTYRDVTTEVGRIRSTVDKDTKPFIPEMKAKFGDTGFDSMNDFEKATYAYDQLRIRANRRGDPVPAIPEYMLRGGHSGGWEHHEYGDHAQSVPYVPDWDEPPRLELPPNQSKDPGPLSLEVELQPQGDLLKFLKPVVLRVVKDHLGHIYRSPKSILPG